MQTLLFFAAWRGRIAEIENYFGNNFYVIPDTDTENYYFLSISAMNSDKRYCPPMIWAISLELSGNLPLLRPTIS